MDRIAHSECGAEEMSELLDITPRRLQQLVSEGIIPKQRRGHYKIFECTRAYIRYLRKSEQSHTIRGSIEEEKLRKTKAEADLAEIEVETIKSNLLHKNEVISVTAQWIHHVKTAVDRLNLPKEKHEKLRQILTSPIRENTTNKDLRK